MAAAKPAESTYDQCRKKALSDHIKSNKDIQRLALKQCLIRFPSAGLYTDCKRQVVEKFGKDLKKAKEKLQDCRKLRQATEYRVDEVLPYFRVGDRHFYAGADLSYEVSFANIPTIPNFSCNHLSEVLEDLDSPEYLLFGNLPQLFTPLKKFSRKTLKKSLKGKALPKKSKDPFVDVPKLGRIYVGESVEKDLLFFPTSHCAFQGNLGSSFEDHKLYYLIDQSTKQLLPYFGASFYRQLPAKKAKAHLLDSLQKLLIERLGPNYKVTKLTSGALLIADFVPTEFDSEGDPKNLCREPRPKSSTLALLRPDKKNALQAAMVVVANTRNLCQFGDRLRITLD